MGADEQEDKTPVNFIMKVYETKALAEEEVEKTDAGKKLVHLRALKENCQDQVMEASVSGDLKESLNHVLKTVGLQWNASYIPLAKPKK